MPIEPIVFMTAPEEGKTAETGVSVGWSEGTVQIILHADPRHLEKRIELFAKTVGDGAATKVASPELSRAELNKLIRALRTARDKAYGRDE